ncbi:MAG: sigma-70 family RNA polymerase sigma factor [Acidobacteriota bacterium]|nr:sigma-70 family RNA polymerase sigma factor [Acidobacteriota bacterium]
MRSRIAGLLCSCAPMIEQWWRQAGAEDWGISAAKFTAELARCAEARFRAGAPGVGEFQSYLGALHLEDLALACACAQGVTEAWEYFVTTYRGYMRASAGAILKRSASSPEAEELADSLFAELYGLSAEKRGSLFRYFHGRSSLKTWLRAVLAQRYVDKIRAGRKFEELGDEDGSDRRVNSAVGLRADHAAADPHRARYLAMFAAALETALKNLDGQDAKRLRMYYAEEKKLAEIGRMLGEHESSVSRRLEKVRRDLRGAVEEILRGGAGAVNGEAKMGGLSDAEMELCFEYATEDAPIDLDKLFPQRGVRGAGETEQET